MVKLPWQLDSYINQLENYIAHFVNVVLDVDERSIFYG